MAWSTTPNAQAGQPVGPELHAADMVRAGLAGSIRSYPLQTFADKHRARWRPSTTAASRPATPASRAKWSTTSRTTTTRRCSTSTCSSCRCIDHQRRPRARAGAGHGHQRLQPGRGLLPRRHRRAALEVAGPQQLQFGRLVQPPRLELPGQLLRHRPAAGGRQRQGLRAAQAAAGQRRLQAAAADIAFARDAFRDLLAVRASSTLFRLPAPPRSRRRLRFFNTGPSRRAVRSSWPAAAPMRTRTSSVILGR
jgi:pullulanase